MQAGVPKLQVCRIHATSQELNLCNTNGNVSTNNVMGSVNVLP